MSTNSPTLGPSPLLSPEIFVLNNYVRSKQAAVPENADLSLGEITCMSDGIICNSPSIGKHPGGVGGGNDRYPAVKESAASGGVNDEANTVEAGEPSA